jgi:hypothetical protein
MRLALTVVSPGAQRTAEVDNSIVVIQRLRAAGQPRVNEIQEAADLIRATGTKEDAFDTFAPGWLKTAAGSIAAIRGLSNTLTGLGVIADVGTVISPQDTGVLGGADRATAAVNGALLVLNATTDWVPGWGEAVIAVTGAYLAGDFLFTIARCSGTWRATSVTRS